MLTLLGLMLNVEKYCACSLHIVFHSLAVSCSRVVVAVVVVVVVVVVSCSFVVSCLCHLISSCACVLGF